MGRSMNLIEQVYDLIVSDEENTDKQSLYMRQEYDTATAEERKVVDSIFICLCGYGLGSIINGEAKP